MALVALLRGVNVGGHRAVRPSVVAERLAHLGAVNVGAAGTFVIRHPVRGAQLRTELARKLPFPCEIVICDAREIVGLLSGDLFSGEPIRSDMVRFVSVLARAPRSAVPPLPIRLPSTGRWLVKILARNDRLVVGLYRRHMRVIRYLTTLDRIFGVPVTTRSWRTIVAIARVLESEAPRAAPKTRRPRHPS